MRGFTVNRMCGFHHGFAESRMGMNRLAELLCRDLKMKRGTCFRDQIRRMGADDVDAVNLISIRDRRNQPFR